MGMFCYQCEQAAAGQGCTVSGVCGKDPEVAALQDLLLQLTKEISWLAHQARVREARDEAVDAYVAEALFTTVTNVNFDPRRLQSVIAEGIRVRDRGEGLYRGVSRAAGREPDPVPHSLPIPDVRDRDALVALGRTVSPATRIAADGAERAGLAELVVYGLKGAAAYAVHARSLGCEDDRVYAFFHEALATLLAGGLDRDGLLSLALRCGEANLRAMELLDQGHTEAFGDPTPTRVRVTPVRGKAILVSGHDLQDLYELLRQTKGKGIHVYTHGEMLPAHGYPALRAFPHLVGNYGGAWQDQRREFAAFPGAILMTTNCIQKPAESYADRMFTSHLVAWPGVRHVEGRDFTPVIEAALAAPGFADDAPEQKITVGFGRKTLLDAAGTVLDLIRAGKLRHVFLIGGCDGAKPGRNYYTEFATSVPEDCLILTLACGKYRFNKLSFGELAGLPRLLDVGQCNDAYAAIRLAGALAEAAGCGLNDLPLSLILSWYEQKAVAILLTLLHLGMRGMRLGPSLPAFLTPEVLAVLGEAFDLAPTGTPREDLAAILG
ncbi:MAG: Hydroxylamine reductase [Candidatus Bipolaricaulis sibiricus]|uniref:Hydroxylamine reductase n=1 Tax=Bipolaricaulis sibiricus TaxID=2501609 RepID=A0A410FTW6_BIPS1|nr:MAG: Hydroxylamine reductase [Candidatus Bipolaricaulis sibiricus]